MMVCNVNPHCGVPGVNGWTDGHDTQALGHVFVANLVFALFESLPGLRGVFFNWKACIPLSMHVFFSWNTVRGFYVTQCGVRFGGSVA
jgi:hypothetical protein